MSARLSLLRTKRSTILECGLSARELSAKQHYSAEEWAKVVEWRRGQHRVLGRIVPTAHANGRLGVGQGRERGSFGGAEWTTLERERADGGRRQSSKVAWLDAAQITLGRYMEPYRFADRHRKPEREPVRPAVLVAEIDRL